MHAVHSKLRAGTGEAPTDPASAAATPSSLRSFLHLFDISRTKQRYLNEVLGGGGAEWRVWVWEKNRRMQSMITPTPRGMGLSAQRSGDGEAALASPSHNSTSSTTNQQHRIPDPQPHPPQCCTDLRESWDGVMGWGPHRSKCDELHGWVEYLETYVTPAASRASWTQSQALLPHLTGRVQLR